jgi:hypothetical protein
MYESVTVRPGLTTDVAKKKLENFSFAFKPGGGYQVVLPTNLEQFADNMLVKVAVTAAVSLDAEILPGDHLDEFKYVKALEEYAHGLAAALKESKTTGIIGDKTSGLFHQGYRWAVSQTLSRDENKNWFKHNWTTPWKLLQNKEVWIGNAPGYQKRWYNLIKKACEHLNVSTKKDFLIPYQEMMKKMMHSFSWKQGAVFSSSEISKMDYLMRDEFNLYEQFLAHLKVNPQGFLDNAESLDAEYMRLSSDIRAYDKLVGTIASRRAKIIYSQPTKAKKDKTPKPREAWVAELSLYNRITVTNPTGLLRDERKEFVVPVSIQKNDLAVALAWRQFEVEYRPLFPDNGLIEPWVRQISAICQAVEEADDN